MKQIKALVILIVFLYPASSYGQMDHIRKLQSELPYMQDSLRYVDALNMLAMLSYENSTDTTFYYTTQARAIAERLRYPKGKADAINNLGVMYDMLGNLQLALRYYNDACIRYQKIADSGDIVQTTMNIAMVYKEMGKDQKAAGFFQKAIATGSHLKQDSIMSMVWYNYMLEFPDRFSDDSMLFYINKAKQIAFRYNDNRLLIAIDQLTADYYIKTGLQNKGIALLQHAIGNAINNKMYYLSLDMIIDMGSVYERTDSAKAVSYYQQAYDISIERGYRVYAGQVVRLLYNFYLARKDDATAFYYSKELLNLRDEQEKDDVNSGIDYIEYALKDQQLESAQVRSKYELRLLLLVITICVMAIAVLIILGRNWRRLKKTTAALRVQFQQSESTMEQLDEMNKDYARLIKIVAHDLRGPVSAISMVTAMLLPDDRLDGETKDLLQLVNASSKNCMELINQLMKTDFDQGQNLQKEEVKLSELLQQCVRLLSFRAKDKNQRLVMTNNAQISVTGDEEKLRRVMNNLIVNAIKFSPDGSTINIDSGLRQNKVLITIKDSGIGIPPEMHSKIFDPFTIARRPGTDGEEPFGLGLYISKQIVEAHSGRIWFESEPGKGTTFYIELPVSGGSRASISIHMAKGKAVS